MDLPAGYPLRYMGREDCKIITAPNGAAIWDKALADLNALIYPQKTIEEVCDGVWLIGGLSMAVFYVIEAPEGLIVQDTGENAEEGEHLKDAVAEVAERIAAKGGERKEIKALLYTHSHFAQGGGGLIDDPSSVIVIGHPRHNANVEAQARSGGVPAAIPELGPILLKRGLEQFAGFLPPEGPDSAIANKINFKPAAYLPVTDPVEHGETRDVLGLEMQFFTKHVTDDNQLTTWIPSKRIAVQNMMWPGTPNMVTLRGAVYRDPRDWIGGLKELAALEPEILLTEGGRPLQGKELIAQTLQDYTDLVQLIYDQSLRGILHGLGPEDLKYFIYKPKHLTDQLWNAETYGETPAQPPAPFTFAINWFSGDAAELYALPPVETAARLIELIGGPDEVCEVAEEALGRNEFAWAAQLVNYVFQIDKTNARARKIKASALRAMGQRASGTIPRHFLLSQALALEGRVQIPPIIPQPPEVIAGAPRDFVDYFRVRLDPQKAEDTDALIAFILDGEESVGLHIRRGVAEFIAELDEHRRAPDVSLTLSGEAWAKLYLNQTDIATAAAAGEITVAGEVEKADELFALFDSFALPSIEEPTRRRLFERFRRHFGSS